MDKAIADNDALAATYIRKFVDLFSGSSSQVLDGELMFMTVDEVVRLLDDIAYAIEVNGEHRWNNLAHCSYHAEQMLYESLNRVVE